MSDPATSTPSQTPDAQLDLRGTPCPLNFVRTKLRLEQMTPGMLLEVWLDPGEPIEQVPDSLAMAGYPIEAVEERTDYFALKVRRPLVSA
jgi:TusA-related sulfurtransferase